MGGVRTPLTMALGHTGQWLNLRGGLHGARREAPPRVREWGGRPHTARNAFGENWVQMAVSAATGSSRLQGGKRPPGQGVGGVRTTARSALGCGRFAAKGPLGKRRVLTVHGGSAPPWVREWGGATAHRSQCAGVGQIARDRQVIPSKRALHAGLARRQSRLGEGRRNRNSIPPTPVGCAPLAHGWVGWSLHAGPG